MDRAYAPCLVSAPMDSSLADITAISGRVAGGLTASARAGSGRTTTANTSGPAIKATRSFLVASPKAPPPSRQGVTFAEASDDPTQTDHIPRQRPSGIARYNYGVGIATYLPTNSTGASSVPWTPNDAEKHTRKATTSALKDLWAKVANEALERTGDEGRAVREANAVIARQAEAR
jgi:hypothetical protein